MNTGYIFPLALNNVQWTPTAHLKAKTKTKTRCQVQCVLIVWESSGFKYSSILVLPSGVLLDTHHSASHQQTYMFPLCLSRSDKNVFFFCSSYYGTSDSLFWQDKPYFIKVQSRIFWPRKKNYETHYSFCETFPILSTKIEQFQFISWHKKITSISLDF